jgi:hypothetical protein
MLIMAVVVPCLLGSAINISYNLLRIVGDLNDAQNAVFAKMLLGYNLIVYPLCVALLVHQALPIFFDRTRVDPAMIRRRIVSLPVWIVGLGAIGWIPGGILFPLGLHWAAGPLEITVFGHFLLDFILSGLIAVTYSYFGAQAILLRVLYPRYLIEQPHPRDTARRELHALPRRIKFAQVMAAIIPLLGAILVVLIGPAEREGYAMFRFLVTILIAMGMVGFSLSMTAVGVLQRTLQALTGDSNSE